MSLAWVAGAPRRIARSPGVQRIRSPKPLFRLALRALGLLALLAAGYAQAQAGDRAHLQVEMGTHAGAVRRIAVSAERNLVVTGSDDKSVRVWSVENASPIRVIRPPVGNGPIGRIYGVALHPTKPWLAVGGTTAPLPDPAQAHAIHLFDSVTGEYLRRIDARAGHIKRLVWTPDGELLLAGYAGANSFKAFGPNGELVFDQAFDGEVYAIATHGQQIAVAALSGQVRVYELAMAASSNRLVQRAEFRVQANPTSLAFSPDGNQLGVGYFVRGKAPDVVNLATGQVTPLQLRLTNPISITPHRPGSQDAPWTLHTIAWSSREVLVAGSYGFDQRRVPILAVDPRTFETRTLDVQARDSIHDLVPLKDGRVAYAVGDGSWGIAATKSSDKQLTNASLLPDLLGARHLRVSHDAHSASWTLAGGERRVRFDLNKRQVEFNAGAELMPPKLRDGFSTPSDWEDSAAAPKINGRSIALGRDEISRAVSLFRETRGAALGTSQALIRTDQSGNVQWRVPTQTEVRAVNVTDDDRLVVTAMMDGTIRYWRAADGKELMRLLVLADGRWILWTPDGYFDCSVGADELIGWLMNRPDGNGTQYYSAGRFRQRFHIPQYFDHLLRTLDPTSAERSLLVEANQQSAPASVPAQLPAASDLVDTRRAGPLLRIENFPPSLSTPLPSREIAAASGPNGQSVEVPFTVFQSSRATSPDYVARLDGRPATVEVLQRPNDFDGRSRGLIRVRVEPTAQSLQLLASDTNGFSEPLRFTIIKPAKLAVTAVPPPAPASSEPAVQSPPAASKPSATPATGQAQVPPSASRLPRLFVLAIGISSYQREQYRLRFAAKDAQDFTAAFRAQTGKAYREVISRVLLDRDATRSNIIDQLRWLSRASDRDDVTMLFMSGHGVTGADGKYFFLPQDGKHESPANTAVPEGEIRDALRAIPGRAVFFIDTCYAGNAIGGPGSRNREVTRFVNELASAENGVVVFASSTARQLSLENDEWQNGAFTKALVQGLSGKADLLGRGVITYKGLDYYISEEVKRLTERRQTPVSLSPWGIADFALASI